METFTALALFVSALYAAQNLLRYVKAADWNGVLGILIAVASGVGVVALAAHADVTSGLQLIDGAPALGLINGGSQIMLGIAVGSAGTVLADGRNAIDSSTSAAKPKLVDAA